MKQFFELKIKPINDRLGADLGLTNIKVSSENIEYDIPVKVSFTSRRGNQVCMTNRHIKECRALGLMI